MAYPEFELKTFIESDCQFHAAGRLWVVPEITYTELPDGSTGISAEEIQRIHVAIANEICGSPAALSAEEFDFICDVVETKLNELALLLRMDKSTISRWRRGSRSIPSPISWIIKRWAWYRLFGPKLVAQKVPLSQFETDIAFLPFARNKAIESGLTFSTSYSARGQLMAE